MDEDEKARIKKEQEEKEKEMPQLAVEKFDPENDFAFVSQTVLRKNKDKHFVKQENKDEFIKESHWFTNGKSLVCFNKTKIWGFNLETGLQVAKTKNSPSFATTYPDNYTIGYDPSTSAFVAIHKEAGMEFFTIESFPKGEASVGAAEEFQS